MICRAMHIWDARTYFDVSRLNKIKMNKFRVQVYLQCSRNRMDEVNLTKVADGKYHLYEVVVNTFSDFFH